MIGTILGNLDGITLGLDIGTYLGFLDGSFGGSNDGNLEVFFLETHWYLMMVKCLALMKALPERA